MAVLHHPRRSITRGRLIKVTVVDKVEAGAAGEDLVVDMTAVHGSKVLVIGMRGRLRFVLVDGAVVEVQKEAEVGVKAFSDVFVQLHAVRPDRNWSNLLDGDSHVARNADMLVMNVTTSERVTQHLATHPPLLNLKHLISVLVVRPFLLKLVLMLNRKVLHFLVQVSLSSAGRLT